MENPLKKNVKSWLALAIIILFVQNVGFVKTVNAEINPNDKSIVIEGESQNAEETESLEASKVFNSLKEKINSNRDNLSKSVVNTSLLEERLSEVSDEITSLEDQIGNIDNQLEAAKQNIKSLSKNIRENEEEIDKLKKNIQLLEEEIEKQKEMLKEILLMIFFENEQTGFFDSGDLQAIKLLLGDENVNQMLERGEGLTLLEFSMQGLIEELNINKIKLESDKSDLQSKNLALKKMREDLKDEEVNLALQKVSKEKILEQTKGEEKIYKDLISKAKDEQIKIRKDINSLVEDYSKYKIRFEKEGFGDESLGVTFDSDKLSWPVNPYLGISAYFRDPSYKEVIGMEHNAIDIRQAQNSDLRAPADGVVLKVVTGEDLGYHYIIIGHNNGVMTLYGHLYETFVEAGDNVLRGDIIARTGGMPGTRGAGWLTTGAHLHFEVFLNGIHVDPLLYLDLKGIDQKYLPLEFRDLERSDK